MGRYDVLRRIEALDPARDFREIYRLTSTFEFPWDMNQALSFALFRTYAVPSIGALLARTGELVDRVQKRYDDTVLVLEAMLLHGLTDGDGRTALRRMNQMHRHWAVGEDDLRYVLATFVVTPIRWLDDYGWRPMTEIERIASANYYRELGRQMGIRQIPATWQTFSRHLDAYERAHFGFDPGARRVADATLELLNTFPPNHWLPPALVRLMSHALLGGPRVDACRLPPPRTAAPLPHPSGLPRPHPASRALVRGGLKARGRAERFLPARREPLF